jgi:hypothetical protein
MVFGSRSMDKIRSIQEANGDYETTTASRVIKGNHSTMDEILDEFSMELEKKLKENGFSSDSRLEDDSEKTTVWWLREKPKEGMVREELKEENLSEIEHKESAEPDGEETEYYGDEIEFEDTLNEILKLMDELESEKRGTDQERAKLWEMIKHIEDRKVDLTKDTLGKEEVKIELKNIVNTVEERMNELKMEKIDSGMETKEVDGAIAGIEDKMTELKLSQIENEAEKTKLKRMMDGFENKISQIEDGGIGAEVAKAELEGMMAGIEDMMTELEISQIGSDAEKTELRRMMDEIEQKILNLDERKNTEMEKMLKGMEDKMQKMEIQILGTEERMEELQDEIAGKRLTIEYIQNLDDKGDLEALCKEVGLSCEGNEIELKNRLLGYVEGIKSEEDQRFTKENIERIQTKTELVALCEEANLKRTGKKEELRKRLLDYVKDKEIKIELEPTKDSRFTKENIESIETKAELVALCEEANLKKSGNKKELRKRLLEYVIEQDGKLNAQPISPRQSFSLGAPDKLVYAVLGDMYKHLSLEMGDTVQDYVDDLEGFIRLILEVRDELKLESDDILKSVVIKPNKEKTGEILGKLRTPFLNKVKAENLEVVEPDKDWEGIKLQMEMDRELISATFKTQATKIMMLLRMQPPQKIKKIIEEKGEYTLGVEGYPVTISPKMLTFKVITPQNFEIREVEGGFVYIEKEVIRNFEEKDLPPPPPDYEEECTSLDEEPQQSILEDLQPNKIEKEEPPEKETEVPIPPPPTKRKRKKRTPKKKGFMGKIKKRWKK